MTVDEFCTAYGVTPADMRGAAISAAFGRTGTEAVPQAVWAHWDGTRSRPTLLTSLLQELGRPRADVRVWSDEAVRDFLWTIMLPEEKAALTLVRLPL